MLLKIVSDSDVASGIGVGMTGEQKSERVAVQVRLLLLLLLDFQQRESLSERAGGRVPSQVPPPTARCGAPVCRAMGDAAVRIVLTGGVHPRFT